MKGSNVLIFCGSQMKEAISYFLKEEMMQDEDFEVVSVDKATDGTDGFKIKLQGKIDPIIKCK